MLKILFPAESTPWSSDGSELAARVRAKIGELELKSDIYLTPSILWGLRSNKQSVPNF